MVTNASLQLQTFAPFIDSLVNNSLLQPMPHFNQLLLQFTDIMDLLLIHAVLHCFPNLVINRIEVLAIRRPQIWWDEFWGLMCNQLNSVSLAMLAGALSFWNMKKYPDTSWMAVSVAFPIYLNTGIHKNELCILYNRVWMCQQKPWWTDWMVCVYGACVLEEPSSSLLTLVCTAGNSGATMNTFSSVNHIWFTFSSGYPFSSCF